MNTHPSTAGTSIIGVAMALAAAMLWGTTGTTQSLAPTETSAYWIGALRLAIASLFFVVVTLHARHALPAVLARLRPAARWVLLGGACVAAYNLCFFAGVKATGVATGTALTIGSGPIWAGLLQALITRQPPRPAWWAGTALAVAGVVLMLFGADASADFDPRGVMLCLAAGLGYAVHTLISKHLLGVATPDVVTLSVFSTAAVFAVPLAWLISGPLQAGASTWLLTGYLGVVATGIAYLLFTHAMRHLSIGTGVTLTLAEPVTAFALAVLIVGERPGAQAIAGLLLVLAGLLLVIWLETRKRAPRPARGDATGSVP